MCLRDVFPDSFVFFVQNTEIHEAGTRFSKKKLSHPCVMYLPGVLRDTFVSMCSNKEIHKARTKVLKW